MTSETDNDTNKHLDVGVAPTLVGDGEPSSLRDDHDGDFVTVEEEHDLTRGLHQRHISLIALAGAIVRRSTLSQCAIIHLLVGNRALPGSGRLDSNRRSSRRVTRLCDCRSRRLRRTVCAWGGDRPPPSDRLFCATCRVPGGPSLGLRGRVSL